MARKPQENPQLDMTPMIDVVFELIIFFVVTIKQEDLFTKLNCNRPAPDTGPSKEEDSPNVTIEIGRRYDGSPQGVILYNKREVKRTELDAALRDIAREDVDLAVLPPYEPVTWGAA
jgi:biopolymer transport protein ExbD